MTVKKTDREWRRELTDEQYRVCRQKGTEAPFSGKYEPFDKDGLYCCACCNQVLFDSSAKFNAGCGWPSFWEAAASDALTYCEDDSLGMKRVEVLCSCCDAHLGHVFNDGPEPSGLRYCINSVAMNFSDNK
uniref:peptide-methionine (R)-S-oxide reductase MsrB n=1 Tax=Endozoicomonas sp. Mp262 TaxID=2919499 RepID=UPI00351AD178